jgi:hypothetical protein
MRYHLVEQHGMLTAQAVHVCQHNLPYTGAGITDISRNTASCKTDYHLLLLLVPVCARAGD